jgi:cytoskeletal protein CcmA (bactofilin family)
MTMFNRNDKPSETPSTSPTSMPAPVREQPSAAPTPIETRRATAQPLSGKVESVSVISKALKITGQLESTEDIQIDGEVDGDVRAVSVKVGSNAKVKGTVYGDTVELAGTVDGKIEAKKVILNSTARMSGDVIHQDITIQSGAFIDGHCRPEYGKTDPRKLIPVHKAVSGMREAVETK